MADSLFPAHINNLQESLSKTSQRQSMLMANLANVNVPGYKRQDMDFHLHLSDEFDRLISDPEALRDSRDLRQGDSSGGASQRPDGNSVDLEREITEIAETELRHQVLTDLTAGYFSGLKRVIREGR